MILPSLRTTKYKKHGKTSFSLSLAEIRQKDLNTRTWRGDNNSDELPMNRTTMLHLKLHTNVNMAYS